MPDEFWETLEVVHEAATKRILFLSHAQMNTPDPDLQKEWVVIEGLEIIRCNACTVKAH